MKLRYRVAGKHVIREVFDQEVVMINMESGRYFSTNTLGTQVWRYLEEGASVAELAAALPELKPSALFDFAQQLCLHGLLVEAPELTSGPQLAFEAAGTEPPQLSVYEDLQELLLLDPIHDVNESGWPQAQGA